jgi:hypothetical protein
VKQFGSAALLASALLLAACDAPTMPARTNVYDFHEGSWIFRWNGGSTVRFHVLGSGETAELLRGLTTAAAAVWNDAALFDDYALVPTASPQEAHVLVRWSDDPLPVLVPEQEATCSAAGGRAYVVFCVAADPTRVLRLPFSGAAAGAEGSVRAVVTIQSVQRADTTAARRLVLHELGHVLGIWNHSQDPGDVMFGGLLTVDALSAADRATIHVLYRTPPTVSY